MTDADVIIVAGLLPDELLHHVGNLLHVLLLIKHLVIKDGQDLSPPHLSDVAANQNLNLRIQGFRSRSHFSGASARVEPPASA